jgi:hypothetical protein
VGASELTRILGRVGKAAMIILKLNAKHARA